MTDIAALNFSIDSSDARDATSNLDAMQQKAALVAQQTGQMTTRLQEHQIALRAWRTDAQAFTGVLIQTNNALNDMLDRLDRTRAALDGSAASFSQFSVAQKQVDALASSFNQTSTAIEAYTNRAATLGLTTTQTVQSLQRVTEALQGQGEAAKTVQQVFAAYGINTSGLGANSADQVLQSFVDKLRTISDSSQKLQSAQAVLGPNIDAQTLSAISQPQFLSSSDRYNRDRQLQITQQVNDTTRGAAALGRQTSQTRSTYGQLSDDYNVTNYGLFSGLSSDQRAALSQKLGPTSDYNVYGANTIAGRTALLQYLDANPDSAEARSARTPFAALSRYYNESDVGHAIQYQLGANPSIVGRPLTQAEDGSYVPSQLSPFEANRAAIGAQYTQDFQQNGFFSAFGSYLGNNVRNALGTFTPRPQPADPRNEDPDPFFLNQGSTASTLGQFGFSAPGDYLKAQEQLRDLQLPLTLQRFVGAYGSEGGQDRYNSVQSDLQARVATALNPGESQIESLNQASVLQGIPLAQRGTATQLLSFLQGQGYSTRPFTQGATGPEQLQGLLGASFGGGSLNGIDGKTLDAFQQIQGKSDNNKIAELNEDLQTQLDLQTKLQAIAGQGSAATQDLTTRETTYTAALKAGSDATVARQAAENALLEVQAKRKTAIDDETAALKAQNDVAGGRLQNQIFAGSDPVARATYSANDDIQQQLDNLRKAGGTSDQVDARQTALRQQLGVNAQTSVQSSLASSQQELKTAQELNSVAGARADIQKRISDNIQIELQFAKQLGEAYAAAAQGNTQALDVVLKQIEAAKQLKAQTDAVNQASAVTRANVGIGNQANLDQTLAGFSPEQRREFQTILPDLRQGNYPSSGVAGQIAGAAPGYGVDPATALIVAQRESTVGANPDTNTTVNPDGTRKPYSGIFQLQTGTPGDGNSSTADQISYGLKTLAQVIKDATAVVGHTPTPNDVEMTHMQGPTGYKALYNADPNDNAINALAAGSNVSRSTAALRITQNGGTTTDTVGSYLQRQQTFTDQATSAVGSATDADLAHYFQVATTRGLNDPEILALPQVQQDNLRLSLQKYGTGVNLAGTGTLQSGAQSVTQQQRLAAVGPNNPAGSLAVENQNAADRLVLGGQLTPEQVPQFTAQQNTAKATSLTTDLNQQTTQLNTAANSANALAIAYGQGAAAVSQLQEAIKIQPFQQQIDALKQQKDQTGQTSAAIDGATTALTKYEAALQSAATSQANEKVAQANKSLADANAQLQASLNVPVYATDAERLQANAQFQKDQFSANNPNASPDQINQHNSLVDQNTSLQQQKSDADTLQTAYKSATGALVNGFENAIVSGANLHTTMATLLQDLEKIAIQAAITKPLENAISGGIGSIFGGSTTSGGSPGGGASSVAGTVSGVASKGLLSTVFGSIGDFLGLARGGVIMNGNLIPFARGGMLDRPTLIPMANGSTALAGEAGNGEALMPVRRLPNGDLGIQAHGAGGGGVTVHAPITIQGGQKQGGGGLDKATGAQFQKQIEDMVRSGVKNVLLEQQRPGGMLYQ